MTELRLILGDQLNPLHSWFAQPCNEVVYLLLELRQETGYVLHHAQKLLAVLAAMRDFARQLKAAGHRVRYVTIDHPSNRARWKTISTPCYSTTSRRHSAGSSRTNGGWTSNCSSGQRDSRSPATR